MLPDTLLQSIMNLDGGRLTLVIGAGTSRDLPTDIPGSKQLSRQAYRRLVNVGVIAEGAAEEEDLGALADAVIEATGSKYRLIVELKRIAKFEDTPPNEGHRLAAAMLREGAIANVLTLNYDVAMNTALSIISEGRKVQTISDPSHHDRYRVPNLVYLHRNVHSDHDDWVMTTEEIEERWQDGWEQIVSNIILGGAPVVAFVGVASSAPVLSDTVRNTREMLNDLQSIYFVGPGSPQETELFEELDLPEESALPLDWITLMRGLSDALLNEHVTEIREACSERIQALGLPEEQFDDICNNMVELGLLGLGKLRARWMLEGSEYAARQGRRRHIRIADLILAIALLERVGECEAHIHPHGTVEVRDGDTLIAYLLVAHGCGIYRWDEIQVKLRREAPTYRHLKPTPRHCIVICPDGRNEVPSPLEIDQVEVDPDDISQSTPDLRFITVDEARRDPDQYWEWLQT